MLSSIRSKCVLRLCNSAQLGHLYNNSILNTSSYAAETNNKSSSNPGVEIEQPQKKATSKAMRAYLERAKAHKEFMDKQTHEFQIGKRHLANMMGEDPETFTQQDIDNAIEYLFPSGLYDKAARPLMRPPEEIYPQRKAAEFDETGRPYHFLFYTGKPNFFKLLFDITEKIIELNRFEDVMIRKGLQPDENLILDLSGYEWVDKEVLGKEMVEVITDREHESFIAAMERLTSHPFSYRLKDFILTYKIPLMNKSKTFEIPKLQYDADGRAYITTYECLRKRARGHVTLRSPGNGIVTINGQDLTYFKDTQPREQVSAY